MDKKQLFSKVAPAVVLAVLALAIPEILMGSTPVSRADQWLFEFAFYGSGALLIREVVLKFKLGWLSVVILGLAFGLAEEGLFLQSAFNPKFLNLNLSYGRALGVNWVWAQFIIGYHALFSISIPIFLTELIFRNRKDKPWLSKPVFWIICVVFALSSLSFYYVFYNMSKYNASIFHFLMALIFIIGLVVLAFKLRVKPVLNPKSQSPLPIVVGLIAFIACLAWLGGLYMVFTKGGGLPSWVIQLSGLVVLVGFGLIASGWLKQTWTLMNQFLLLCGGLCSGMLYGFIILYQQGNRLDIYSQIGFIFITGVLLSIFERGLKQDI